MSGDLAPGSGASTPAVAAAVAEIRARFPSTSAVPDGSGGAFVLVDDVPLGSPFAQDRTWVGFHVTGMCPYADVYPHYMRPDLTFADGRALAVPLHAGHAFPPAQQAFGLTARPSVMVSRISRRRDGSNSLETPFLKLLKVLECMRSL